MLGSLCVDGSPRAPPRHPADGDSSETWLAVNGISTQVEPRINVGGKGLQVGVVQHRLNALPAPAHVGVLQVDVRRHAPGPVLGLPDVRGVLPEGEGPVIKKRHDLFQRTAEQQVIPTTSFHPCAAEIEAVVGVAVPLPEAEEAPVGSRGEPPGDVHQGPALLVRNGTLLWELSSRGVAMHVIDILAQAGDAVELHQGMDGAPG